VVPNSGNQPVPKREILQLPHLTTVENYEAILPWNLKPSAASFAQRADARQNAVT